jgi:hypothetical protein
MFSLLSRTFSLDGKCGALLAFPDVSTGSLESLRESVLDGGCLSCPVSGKSMISPPERAAAQRRPRLPRAALWGADTKVFITHAKADKCRHSCCNGGLTRSARTAPLADAASSAQI